MTRANEEWEFLYNKLKTENKILKEYETYIFSYAHENLGVDTLGMHIAAGLVKEHRELKKENSKLREENEQLDMKLNAYISGVDQLNNIWLEHGCEKSSMRCLICKVHDTVRDHIDKALRGADEKD